ncbi:ABC transporter permease [Candidatus Bathyarchaeota archaeon]|nr:ABC transporter permease [Candidatus Bathyarchaeota archaeon]
MRKLRAGLTTLGVVIGIAAIVALLSITQGLQNTITGQLQRGFATDTLIVTAGRGFGAGANGGVSTGGSGILLINDTQIINGIENVTMSTAVIQKVGYVRFGDRERVTSIVGVDFAEYASIYSSTFVGDSVQIPSNPGADTVVVGKRVSDPWKNGTILCSANDAVEVIWPNATARPPKNETYAGTVASVLKEVGGFGIGGPSDSSVYIPISQAQSFFGTDECDTIIVKLKSDDKATIDGTSKAITSAFNGEVSVVSSTAVLSILSSVFSIIELFLAGIAAISLLVAGIGIMNIMIVSLMERTREIGILKALGMKSRTVLLIFLCESVIIGLMGALIGVASGWILANVVAVVFRGGGGGGFFGNQGAGTGGMTITPVLTPTVTILALTFGIGISAIFAIYPAWRASKLKPVDALRYE